jgi:2-iminobutanoate/2-iminopropanoate deaminase
MRKGQGMTDDRALRYWPVSGPAAEAARAGGFTLPFSAAVRVGGVLYLSGQIGARADGSLPDGIEAQARQAMANVGAVLAEAGLGFGDVFHCLVMLADMAEWGAFNRVYVDYFDADRLPARSAFAASGLALGARVEIECKARSAAL